MTAYPVEKLEKYLSKSFVAWGASSEDANEVSTHLIEASLSGHDSHGVLRAPWYLEKIKKNELVPDASVQVLNETPSSAVLDGQWGFGQPICRQAMDLCIQKAQESVIACVTVKNCNHMGRVGYYTQIAADSGMVGLGCVNLHGSSHCVAPFGGIDRRLPTNPFSVSYPTKTGPHLLTDFTSSIVAEGKLQLRRNNGGNADDGWIIDHNGNPTKDPHAFYDEPKGALLPMGGAMAHKGYALSMAIEGLAGGLSGAGCSSPGKVRHGNACWFVAIRIDAFTPFEQFLSNVDDLIDYVKSSRKIDDSKEIHYPGEPEDHTRSLRLVNGISVDAKTWEWLGALAGEKGVMYD